jgi:hypothetical protein
MPPRTMTFGDWKKRLGPAVPLDRIPAITSRASHQIAAAVRAGELRVHTFRGANGKTYQWVRLEDVLRYLQAGTSAKPKITLEGMARAFRQMVGEEHQNDHRRSA